MPNTGVNQAPFFSVIMSVLNENPAFLAQAVNSILGQSFGDFEMIIIDDGTTNQSTLNYLSTIRTLDSRVTLEERPHCGLADSLNFAAKLSKGTYILRQDSDDWSEPNRMFEIKKYIAQNPNLMLIGSWCIDHQENGKVLWQSKLPESHGEIISAMRTSNPFVHGSVAIQREIFFEIGGYRSYFKQSQDYDLFSRISEKFPTANIPKSLYHRRYQRGSVSTKSHSGQAIYSSIIRNLADQRALNSTENFDFAENTDGNSRESCRIWKSHYQSSDNLLLAGHYCVAIIGYAKHLAKRPSLFGLGKLFRGIIFIMIPCLRPLLFKKDQYMQK
jgi:glycosyltransferase involved in cell wall biosynthesis